MYGPGPVWVPPVEFNWAGPFSFEYDLACVDDGDFKPDPGPPVLMATSELLHSQIVMKDTADKTGDFRSN